MHIGRKNTHMLKRAVNRDGTFAKVEPADPKFPFGAAQSNASNATLAASDTEVVELILLHIQKKYVQKKPRGTRRLTN